MFLTEIKNNHFSNFPIIGNKFMSLLSEIKGISISANIALENVKSNAELAEVDVNDFTIKKVEMVSNYKLKLYLENNAGDKGCSYITAVGESTEGRNILSELLLNTKIINIPLGILPKLDLDGFIRNKN